MFTGEPDAGNLHVRFDEGECQARVAPQRPCHSLLYREIYPLKTAKNHEGELTQMK